MEWQYIVFTFLAGFPAVMWLVGQIMEQRLEKKGWAEGGDDYNPGLKAQLLTFLLGICSIITMIGLSIGAFGYPVFAVIGLASAVLALYLLKKVGVFDTMMKG